MNAMDRKEVGDYNESDYDDMLNEIYSEVNVGVTFQPARVLSELDPIAYHCGFNDWVDGLEDDYDGGRYECSICGDRFRDERDAEECCKPEDIEEDEN